MSRIHWTGHSPLGEPFSHVRDFKFSISIDSVTNIFVIGEGIKPWISLPKGKGTKLTISEERDVRRKQKAADQ